MAQVFATLIINKRKKFSDVPPNLKDSVQKILSDKGYDNDGNPVAA